jgi:hypothetical protein
MAVEFKLRKTKGETMGSESGGVRSFSQSEKRGYIDYINQEMAGEEDLPGLPVDTNTDDIFTLIADGVLFAYVISSLTQSITQSISASHRTTVQHHHLRWAAMSFDLVDRLRS